MPTINTPIGPVHVTQHAHDRKLSGRRRPKTERPYRWLPFVGQDLDAGEKGLARLTRLPPEAEAMHALQYHAIAVYLKSGRNPHNYSDGQIVSGVDFDTGLWATVELCADPGIIDALKLSVRLRK